jgi:uncharacterized HAD superfamily protein
MVITKLGIDIDGCLNDFQAALALILARDYDSHPDPSEYEMLGDLNLKTIEQYRDFWDKYNEELFRLLNIEENAVQVTSYFKKKGTEINIITAREYNVAKLTEQWLNKYNVERDNLFFAAGNKLDVCKWKQIEYMIEDKPDNAILLAENGIRVLLFDRPYNKKVEHSNVKRVYNWMDIYDHLTNGVFKEFMLEMGITAYGNKK